MREGTQETQRRREREREKESERETERAKERERKRDGVPLGLPALKKVSQTSVFTYAAVEHKQKHTHGHKDAQTLIHTCTHRNHTHIHTPPHINRCKQTHTHTYIYIYICVCVHTRDVPESKYFIQESTNNAMKMDISSNRSYLLLFKRKSQLHD